MDVLTFSSSQPPLRLVAVWLGEDGRVSEVNAGVQVQVGPGRDLVARQDKVLLAVARHLGAVRPQPRNKNDLTLFFLTLISRMVYILPKTCFFGETKGIFPLNWPKIHK